MNFKRSYLFKGTPLPRKLGKASPKLKDTTPGVVQPPTRRPNGSPGSAAQQPTRCYSRQNNKHRGGSRLTRHTAPSPPSAGRTPPAAPGLQSESRLPSGRLPQHRGPTLSPAARRGSPRGRTRGLLASPRPSAPRRSRGRSPGPGPRSPRRLGPLRPGSTPNPQLPPRASRPRHLFPKRTRNQAPAPTQGRAPGLAEPRSPGCRPETRARAMARKCRGD